MPKCACLDMPNLGSIYENLQECKKKKGQRTSTKKDEQGTGGTMGTNVKVGYNGLQLGTHVKVKWAQK